MDGRHPEFNSGSREIFSVIPAKAGISGIFMGFRLKAGMTQYYHVIPGLTRDLGKNKIPDRGPE
jgi:hypothetical protein